MAAFGPRVTSLASEMYEAARGVGTWQDTDSLTREVWYSAAQFVLDRAAGERSDKSTDLEDLAQGIHDLLLKATQQADAAYERGLASSLEKRLDNYAKRLAATELRVATVDSFVNRLVNTERETRANRVLLDSVTKRLPDLDMNKLEDLEQEIHDLKATQQADAAHERGLDNYAKRIAATELRVEEVGSSASRKVADLEHGAHASRELLDSVTKRLNYLDMNKLPDLMDRVANVDSYSSRIADLEADRESSRVDRQKTRDKLERLSDVYGSHYRTFHTPTKAPSSPPDGGASSARLRHQRVDDLLNRADRREANGHDDVHVSIAELRELVAGWKVANGHS